MSGDFTAHCLYIYTHKILSETVCVIYENILKATGNTPLIKLNNMTDENCAEILVKFEGLNVGGSIKTRTALNMIEEAEKKGLLNPESVIVEPTSGNQGIGLALVGAVKGYKTVLIMPDSVSEERRKLARHYGAKVILVHDENDIGACIKKCIKIANDLAECDLNVFIPSQFENPDNPLSHIKTAQEILDSVRGKIDGFCCGVGTGGSITGIGKMLKKHNTGVVIRAVEPENAAILSGGKIGSHMQMGIGDGIIPKILNTSVYDGVIVVKDEDAIATAKQLALKEGIACGISSGANVFAAITLAKELGKDKRVVTLLPDTAERYFSTPLFDGE